MDELPVMMYVHGFMSGANGAKHKQLQEYFEGLYRVIAPELDADPDKSLAILNEIIQKEKPEVIIGTSLGGWMTLMCDSQDAKLVIVNPTTEPVVTLGRWLNQPQKYFCKRLDGVQLIKMFMKKYLKLLFVALFATMSFAFTACGDDDDEPQEFGSIVGTWKMEVVHISDDWWQVNYANFEEGGKYIAMDVVYFMGDYDVSVDTYRWSQSGNVIESDGDKGTITKMTSNSMTFKDDKSGIELTYTRCPKEEMEQYLKYVK